MDINEVFPRVYVINLRRRKDRRMQCFQELAGSGIDPFNVEWVEACEDPENGNRGCTKSHRALLRRVADGPYERVLILEDDFQVITMGELLENGFREYPGKVMEAFRSVLDGMGNLAERFEYLSDFLPRRWDVIYLGAGYGESPISRLNRHVLRVGFMQTTGCYGITRDFARIWTDKIDAGHGHDDIGPIDNLLGSLAHDYLYYCLQPRLAFQRKSVSDLSGLETSYLMSMTDPHHENLC